MKFSNTSYKYLDKLTREKHSIISDRQVILDYFKNQDLPPFEKIIEFQFYYSGLNLTITNRPKSTFSFHLLSKPEIEENKKIDTLEVNEQLYFFCGDHITAQFHFVIGTNGEIGTYENFKENVNIISSSAEKFIESYAFEDLLMQDNKFEFPYYYNLLDNAAFGNLTSKYFKHKTASDNYTTWLSDLETGLIVKKGTWYDRPESYIHVYGNTEDQCKRFVQTLKDRKIIE